MHPGRRQSQFSNPALHGPSWPSAGFCPLVADSDGRYGDRVFLEDEDDFASGLGGFRPWWVCQSTSKSGLGLTAGSGGNPSTAALGAEHFAVVCSWVEASGVSGTGGVGGAPEATYWKQMDSS